MYKIKQGNRQANSPQSHFFRKNKHFQVPYVSLSQTNKPTDIRANIENPAPPAPLTCI